MARATPRATGSVPAVFRVVIPDNMKTIVVEELDEFIDRWAGWLSDAAQGVMGHPSRMSERDGPKARSGAADGTSGERSKRGPQC